MQDGPADPDADTAKRTDTHITSDSEGRLPMCG